MMVQLLGGLSAASIAPRRRTARSSLKPVAHAWADFIVAELIFTFGLAFVVQSVVTVSSSLSQFFGCYDVYNCPTLDSISGAGDGHATVSTHPPAASYDDMHLYLDAGLRRAV
jgi:hypothetical protein